MAQLELVALAEVVLGQARHPCRQSVLIAQEWPIFQLAGHRHQPLWGGLRRPECAAQTERCIDRLLIVQAVHRRQLLFQSLQLPFQSIDRGPQLLVGR